MPVLLRTSFTLLAQRWKRFASIILLIALLSLVAGLLGSTLLYSDQPIDPLTIAIVDLDNTMESRLAFSFLNPSNTSEFLEVQRTTTRRAEELLDEGVACAVFTVPEGFTQSVYQGKNIPITATYNPEMPMRASLVRLLADSALDLLRTSQTGIYSTLDFLEEEGAAGYQQALEGINWRYLNWAMTHTSLFEQTTVIATGQISLSVHYLVYALIFLATLSVMLFVPVIRDGFSHEILWRLRSMGVSGIKIATSWTTAFTGWTLPFALLLAILYCLAATSLELPYHPAALGCLFLLCVQMAAFTTLTSFLFRDNIGAGVFLCVASICALVVSGGILPHSFLPEAMSKLAVFFPTYWSGLLLSHSLYGRFDTTAAIMVAVFTLIMLLLSGYCANLRGKAVSKL